jgi:predicted amidophosphoribosyltransferase
MDTKECPGCAMPVDYEEYVCPICKFEFPQKNKMYGWVAVALAVLFLLLMFM